MEDVLIDKKDVKGQIYLMTNTLTNKVYVGQTVSHRKNRGKYRPFGYIGRFKDHISEALCNTKKKQCTYLNNSIRKDGKDAFHVKLLHTCLVEELDEYEKYYIKEYNSLYPNGYNLTTGGKTCRVKSDEIVDSTLPAKKRGGCSSRTDDTREKISKQVKKALSSDEARIKRMSQTQTQHMEKKRERFAGTEFDKSDLTKYIFERTSKYGPYIEIKLDAKSAHFVGKHQTIDELRKRAQEFLESL
jgi:predicted nucleic acid-binding Zn finger protein